MKKLLVSVLVAFVLMLAFGVTLVIAQQAQSPAPLDASSVFQQPITATTSSSIELLLRSGSFDPLEGAPQTPATLSRNLLPAQNGLRLVQFTGPIQSEWYTSMEKAGLEVIVYLPDYAYLVWSDEAALKEVASVAPVRWSGIYQPLYALSPELTKPASLPKQVDVTVQLFNHPGVELTQQMILGQAKAVGEPESILSYVNLKVNIASDQLNWLASLPDVVNVEPAPHYQKMDEIQGQILAGNLNASGTQPSSPGYLYWLTNTVGLTTDASAYPIVDVTDDGIDNGTATPLHPDFWTFGDTATTDRLIYNYNWTTDATPNGLDGHGNINASIVAGFNDKSGFPYEDVSGATANYNFGLGINPFGRVAGSKIFNNSGTFQAPAYSLLISNTYALGARISTNSWGSHAYGAYDTASQAYDALVRDAQPGTGAYAGNQPMITVFSAGNDGSGVNTVGSPGTAKNIISVGAAENPRPGWTDGCGVGPTGADNAQDIIYFSSRGPTDDNRVKPDIMAPGTHIQGAASQATGYTGSSVCDKYMPAAGQTLYAASSGTSHSAPAIAGAASLVYRYYQDKFGGQPPSPAMTKAYLMNAARYLTGVSANDTLPSNNQGTGEANLGVAFDNVPRLVVDQSYVFSNTGQLYQLQGTIPDGDQPYRVTLAWTDAPGATTGNAYVNNLDLAVTIGGNTYLGNVFSGKTSATGGTADVRNNVESVFLPAGVSGYFSLVITATNIAGDGVPGNAYPTDQDFALVVYNAGPDATGAVSGKVADAVTTAPIAGAQVSARSGSHLGVAVADAAGQYTMTHLISGTYIVTATAYGYLSSSIPNVVVTTLTTTQDISLTPQSAYIVSGTIKDAAANWPLHASIAITPYPYGTLWSDPVTGFYSVTLPEGTAYTFNVSASGYNTISRTFTVTGPRTENFDLSVDAFSCTALGYQKTTTALAGSSTSFDDATTFPPTGWAKVDVSGTVGDWTRVTAGTSPTNAPHSGAGEAKFNSYDAVAGNSTRLYRSAGEDLSTVSGAQASFWLYRYYGTAYDPADDIVQVQVSTDGGTTWNNVGAAAARYDSTLAGNTGRWQQYTYDLSQFTGTGMADVRLGLLGISAYGYNMFVDDVTMSTYTCTPQNGGLVVGHVYEAGTLTPLSGATVAQTGSTTTTNASGFYTLFSPSGAQTFTATMTGYATGVTTTNIVPSITQRVDFFLPFNTTGFTWTGSTDTNWFIASNWNPAAVPTTTGSVVIPTAPTGNRWPILTGTATIYNLTLQSSAYLTITSGITLSVNGLVSNTGTLAQIKNVPTGAATEFLHLTDATGSSDKYHGVDLTPGTTALGVTTVQVKGNQAACTTVLGDPIIHRCYQINPTTPVSATLRFWFTEAERNGQVANQLKLWHWNPWTQVGSDYLYSESGAPCTSGSGSACWFQATGISAYSPFALGAGLAPSAVQLTGLEARTTTWLPALLIGALLVLGLSVSAIAIKRRRA